MLNFAEVVVKVVIIILLLFIYSLAETGDIAIQSSPKDAQIYLDGIKKDITTPNYLTNIRVGTHKIRLIKNGYATKDTTITVTKDSICKISLALSPRCGNIFFTGNPIGAKIIKDGIVIGTIPDTIKNISLGNHIFTLSKPFYQSQRTLITVKENQTIISTIILKKSYGVIYIPPVPINVAWKIDNEKVATGYLRFNKGTHQLTWSGGGLYQPIDTIISVNISDTTKLDIKYTPLYGSLKILPLPMACDIIVDGKKSGTAPKIVSNLKLGKHTIAFIKNGYKDTTITVTISENRLFTLNCKLSKATTHKTVTTVKRAIKKEIASQGEVSFISFPPCAKVFKGDSLIAITGKGSVKIAEGTYNLKFVIPNSVKYKRVVVASNSKKAILVNFSE